MATDTSPEPGFSIRTYDGNPDQPLAGVQDIAVVLTDGQRLNISISSKGLEVRLDSTRTWMAVLPQVSNVVVVTGVAR